MLVDLQPHGYGLCKLYKLLNIRKSTNLNALYGDFGRMLMLIYRKLIMIKYWINILKTNGSILYNMYIMLKNDIDQSQTYNKNNWAFHTLKSY